MRYLAANGVTPTAVLTEAEALEDYQRAQSTPGLVVEGTFGKAFTIYLVAINGIGRPATVAETTYLPAADD